MNRYRSADYAAQFKQGDLLTRADLAERFGVGRSTATYHLDRAVNDGMLNRQWGWTGRQSGWLYALPETMQRMAGF